MTPRRAFRATALLVVAGALGGCMLVSTSSSQATTSCGGIPSAACTEQADRIRAAHGGRVREVALECRLGVGCTRAQGAGTASVTLEDGTVLSETWSYVGDPGPLPVPVCVGIAQPLCRAKAAELADDVPPSTWIAGVTLTCLGSCDVTNGEVDVLFRLRDGSTMSVGHGWSSP